MLQANVELATLKTMPINGDLAQAVVFVMSQKGGYPQTTATTEQTSLWKAGTKNWDARHAISQASQKTRLWNVTPVMHRMMSIMDNMAKIAALAISRKAGSLTPLNTHRQKMNA